MKASSKVPTRLVVRNNMPGSYCQGSVSHWKEEQFVQDASPPIHEGRWTQVRSSRKTSASSSNTTHFQMLPTKSTDSRYFSTLSGSVPTSPQVTRYRGLRVASVTDSAVSVLPVPGEPCKSMMRPLPLFSTMSKSSGAADR